MAVDYSVRYLAGLLYGMIERAGSLAGALAQWATRRPPIPESIRQEVIDAASAAAFQTRQLQTCSGNFILANCLAGTWQRGDVIPVLVTATITRSDGSQGGVQVYFYPSGGQRVGDVRREALDVAQEVAGDYEVRASSLTLEIPSVFPPDLGG